MDGLIPLFLIRILDKILIKSKGHIMVGDCKDIKKDFEQSHS